MNSFAFKVSVLIALGISSGTVGAQKIYKCGDSYSQTPCPDGQVIDASDTRTAQQKAQADLATRRDAKAAAAMEQERLAQEKKGRAAKPLPAKSKKLVSSEKADGKQVKKKKRQPEFFTAQVAGSKVKSKAANKKAVAPGAAASSPAAGSTN